MGRLTRSRLIEDMHPNDITVLSAFQGVPSTSAHKPYISNEHHHAQGVFNVVFAGEKTWVLFDFCRPGQRQPFIKPKDNGCGCRLVGSTMLPVMMAANFSCKRQRGESTSPHHSYIIGVTKH